MMGKTLIVFSTISGLNDEVAHLIADALKTTYNMDATVVDLRKGPPDITPFQNVVVGGGGGGKTVYDEAVDFMAKDFEGKNVAFYFLCEGGENPNEENTKASQKKLLSKNISVKPIDVAAFGGCMISQNRTVMDDLNMAKVKDWAIELGKKLDIPQPINLLNTVPFENRFQFYTELGKNTGITASGTVEFAEKLQTIPLQSVTFHFHRRDFQTWLQTSVYDEELSRRIDKINLPQNDEDLRKELTKTTQERITELKNLMEQ
jgi:menaquinone-dependent protoporphyrinogen IX oxidase